MLQGETAQVTKSSSTPFSWSLALVQNLLWHCLCSSLIVKGSYRPWLFLSNTLVIALKNITNTSNCIKKNSHKLSLTMTPLAPVLS